MHSGTSCRHPNASALMTSHSSWQDCAVNGTGGGRVPLSFCLSIARAVWLMVPGKRAARSWQMSPCFYGIGQH